MKQPFIGCAFDPNQRNLRENVEDYLAELNHYRPRGSRALRVEGAKLLNKPDDVEFRQWTRWQYGTATGCGYDKATAALSGMTIAGITIRDDGYRWANQLEAADLTVIEAV